MKSFTHVYIIFNQNELLKTSPLYKLEVCLKIAKFSAGRVMLGLYFERKDIKSSSSCVVLGRNGGSG